jgi:phosphatidylinositol alpha-1,6-mannosyltransferase
MKKTRNVLIVSKPISPPWQDGTKNLAKNIINYVNNVRFQILTPKGYKFKKANVISEDIYQTPKDYTPSIPEDLQALFHLITARKKIDLFHFIFTPNVKSSIVLKHLTGLKNKPTIQTVTRTPINLKPIKHLLFASKTLVLSDHTYKTLAEEGFENIVKINPGVDLEEIEQSKLKESDFKARHNLSNNFIVMYPGDYDFSNTAKGVIETIPPVVSRYPDVRYILTFRSFSEETRLKETELRQYIIDLGIEKYVRIFNQVEDMYEVLQAADVFLFPVKALFSKVDIPLILLEAMAFSKPIILSNASPLDEVIVDDKEFVLDPDDVTSITRRIINLIDSEELCKNRGEISRDIIEKRFNMQFIACEYEKLYQEFLYDR